MHGINRIGGSEQVRARNVRELDDSLRSHEDPDQASPTDFPLTITAMPINAAQRRVALGVMLAVLLIELAAAPFAHLPVAHIDSFIPVLQSVLCTLHVLTAILLFSQHSVRPRFATLALASGYLFSGLFAFAQTLAFPAAYSSGVVLGDINTGVWLFVLWHTVFPLSAILYALTKDAKEAAPSTRLETMTITTAVASVVAAAIGLTWLLVVSSAYLPKFFSAGSKETIGNTIYYVDIYLWLLNSTALALLCFRRRTVLDLWLIVSLFAWWPLFLVPIYFSVVRFSIGWYVSRCLAVLADSALLGILMGESVLLYARLATSMRLQRRERVERLATVEAATSALAHEFRQPLAGIANMGMACVNWLKASPANIERARECASAIVDACHRAEEIISVINGLFRTTTRQRKIVQLHDVCRDVMKLVEHEISTNGISVSVRCQEKLPLINADHTQLQQVMINLVRNAIDAMSTRPEGERRLELSCQLDTKVVTLCVRDSGTGVPDTDREHIFEPFYSTKANGMGLGLAICRKIVEDHGGTLRLAETQSHGSTFEIGLPIR